MTKQLTIDGRIDLTAIMADSDMHLATVIERLQAEGLTRRDAEAFADYAFNAMAIVRDVDPEDCLTAEQRERLTTDERSNA